MKSTIRQFKLAVCNSGLVPENELATAVQGLPEDSPADVAAERLIEKGRLTPWQAAMLLRGKARGFIRSNYRILDHLGSGGMGAVFLAQHTVMGRLVALKLLPKQAATKPAYVKRFLQEAKAVAALDHEHIVRAFDVHGDGDSYFIVLEFIPGDSLGAVVRRDGPLTCEVAAECIRQAADGLAYMHSRGIVHRDIKPENLLAGSDRCVKILDLGLARLASTEDHSITLEYKQTVLGTTDFMAPEQALDSHAVDARADIYSLGCTLYFLLTGEAPFPTGTLAERLLAHQYKAPPDLVAKSPDCPQELAAICQRMMAKKPEGRFASAAAVRDALAGWLRSRDQSLDATEVILVPGSSMQSSACSGSLAELGSRANLAEGDLIQSVGLPATRPWRQSISTETKLMVGSAIAAVLIVGSALLLFSRPPRTGLATATEPSPTPIPSNRSAFVDPKTTWVPSNRLVGHWRLGGAKPTPVDAVPDDSGFEHHGKLLGGLRWAAEGLQLDGVDDCVALGNPPQLDFDGPITLAAWLRPLDSTRRQHIVAHGPAEGANRAVGVFLGIDEGKYGVGSWKRGTHKVELDVPPSDVGSWVHLCGTYDGTAWRLYHQGALAAERVVSQGATRTEGDWAIGARGNLSERFFIGDIREVWIYDRSLTAEEVQRLAKP